MVTQLPQWANLAVYSGEPIDKNEIEIIHQDRVADLDGPFLKIGHNIYDDSALRTWLSKARLPFKDPSTRYPLKFLSSDQFYKLNDTEKQKIKECAPVRFTENNTTSNEHLVPLKIPSEKIADYNADAETGLIHRSCTTKP